MCAVDGAEPFKVSESAKRIARRDHTCDECERIIRAGESYSYVRGLDDYGWASYHTCRHCAAAGAWLDVMCGGYPLGGLLEEIEEYERGYGSPVLGDLLNSTRARWRDGQSPVPDVEALKADARRCSWS